MRFYPGWAERAGQLAGERDRSERGAKAQPLRTERQKLMAARDAYCESQGRKAEGGGKHSLRVAADQWLKDARKEGVQAGDAFASLFDRGEE